MHYLFFIYFFYQVKWDEREVLIDKPLLFKSLVLRAFSFNRFLLFPEE